MEFARDQYGANQAVTTLVLLLVGAGALGGVLAGGWVGDVLLRRGRLTGRVTTAAMAVSVTCVLFLPALLTHCLVGAVPYLVGATFFLTSQNPPLDAARLDIVPGPLWGRAEAVRARRTYPVDVASAAAWSA